MECTCMYVVGRWVCHWNDVLTPQPAEFGTSGHLRPCLRLGGNMAQRSLVQRQDSRVDASFCFRRWAHRGIFGFRKCVSRGRWWQVIWGQGCQTFFSMWKKHHFLWSLNEHWVPWPNAVESLSIGLGIIHVPRTVTSCWTRLWDETAAHPRKRVEASRFAYRRIISVCNGSK